MNNSEIFHNETTYLGGRFDLDRADREKVKIVYGNIRDRAQDLINAARRDVPSLPEIHFDFILNGAINAVAFKSNERYFIGFNTGTIFLLRCVIGRMLSDSRAFKHVGNPEVERGDLKPLEDYVPDAEMMYKKSTLLTPKDPIRRAYADFLQDQAIMFLVGHELTHIIHGHVDYLRAQRGQKQTAELGGLKNRDQQERLERQCIELDADRRSIVSRIDSLRFTFDDANAPNPPWRGKVQHPVEMVFDWAISIDILIRLFGDLSFSRTEAVDSAYPPLLLRDAMFFSAAASTIGEIWGAETQPYAIQALKRARVETEMAFSVAARGIGLSVLDPEFVREGPLHLEVLNRHWMTLRELLEPYEFH
jgi:hypothetical protein